MPTLCRLFEHLKPGSGLLQEWETSRGSDGGEWSLAKEFTWEVFLKVLGSVPSGKAVEEGGWGGWF